MKSRPRTRVQVAAIAAALTLLATMTGSAAAAHGKAAHAAGQQAAITRLGTSHLSAKASKTSYPSVSGEGELRGMQERARQPEHGTPLSIRRIADQRVVDRRQVHADLVGPSGLEAALET